MSRATDEEVVELAKAEGMTVLPEDLDYGAILAATGDLEPGVIILRVGNWPTEQIEQRLRTVLGELPEQSFINTITIIDRYRVRFRRLPVQSTDLRWWQPVPVVGPTWPCQLRVFSTDRRRCFLPCR